MRTAGVAVLIIALFMGLVAAVVPWVARYQANAFFTEHNLGELTIRELAFNPLLLTIRIGGFNWRYQERDLVTLDRGVVDLGWSALLRGEVEVSSVTIDDASLLVQQSEEGWMVVPLPESAEASVDSESTPQAAPVVWIVQAVAASNLVIRIEGTELQTSIVFAELGLKNLGVRPGTGQTEWNISGQLNDADFTLRGNAPLMQSGQRFRVLLELEALPLQPLLGVSGLSRLEGTLSTNLEFEGVVQGSLASALLTPDDVVMKGQAELRGVGIELDSYALEINQLEWRGEVALNGAYPEMALLHQGELSAADLVAKDLTSGVEASIAGVTVVPEARLQSLSAVDTATVSVKGNVNGLAARHQPQSLALLSVDDVLFDGVVFAEGGLKVSTLSITDIELLEQGATIASVALKQLSVGTEISLVDAVIDRVQVQVTLDEAGKPIGLQALDAIEWLRPTEAAVETEPAAPVDLSIGSVIITGDSLLRLTDRSFSPEVSHQLSIQEASLGGVRSGQAANQIPFLLKGRLDEFSSLALDGSVAPFADPLGLSMTVQLAEFPMHEYSPYAERAIGYEMNSGQLDLTTKFSLVGTMLDATVDVEARQFAVNRIKNSEFEDALGMPLGSALGLVRDRNDDITLENLEISGDLSSPDVSIDQIVAKALSKALVTGSMTFLKFALQPYGAVFMAAEAIGKQAGKIRLDPMGFAPGSAEMGEPQTEYLDRIVRILEGRPGLRLVVCGEASTIADVMPDEVEPLADSEPTTPTDLSEQEKQALLALGAERSRSLKRALIAREIESQRISDCKAKLNGDPAGNRLVLAID